MLCRQGPPPVHSGASCAAPCMAHGADPPWPAPLSLGAGAPLRHSQPQGGEQEAAESAPGAQQQAGVQPGGERGLRRVGKWVIGWDEPPGGVIKTVQGAGAFGGPTSTAACSTAAEQRRQPEAKLHLTAARPPCLPGLP